MDSGGGWHRAEVATHRTPPAAIADARSFSGCALDCRLRTLSNGRALEYGKHTELSRSQRARRRRRNAMWKKMCYVALSVPPGLETSRVEEQLSGGDGMVEPPRTSWAPLTMVAGEATDDDPCQSSDLRMHIPSRRQCREHLICEDVLPEVTADPFRENNGSDEQHLHTTSAQHERLQNVTKQLTDQTAWMAMAGLKKLRFAMMVSVKFVEAYKFELDVNRGTICDFCGCSLATTHIDLYLSAPLDCAILSCVDCCEEPMIADRDIFGRPRVMVGYKSESLSMKTFYKIALIVREERPPGLQEAWIPKSTASLEALMPITLQRLPCAGAHKATF